jgi:hypothetical protein
MIRPLAEEIMASIDARCLEFANPLDRVEMLAEQRHWPLDRMSEYEAVMTVSGGWCNLDLCFAWRDELELLQSTCSFDLRVPEARQTEVMRLICFINARLVQGHFDFWPKEGTVLFRESLSLAGAAEANESQCDALIRAGLENCQRYYPAMQLVIWAGQTAEKAIENALLETVGEA